jgi:hypothetical protein
LETIVDFYVELVNFTESNVNRIDTRINNLVSFTDVLYNITFVLFVLVLVLAYSVYKMKLRNDSLQEQIYAVHRKIRDELNPFINS